MHPQAFLDDGFQVRKSPGDVRLAHQPFPPNDTIQLVLGRLQDLRIADQLRHCPFHRHTSSVHSSIYHVLEATQAKGADQSYIDLHKAFSNVDACKGNMEMVHDP